MRKWVSTLTYIERIRILQKSTGDAIFNAIYCLFSSFLDNYLVWHHHHFFLLQVPLHLHLLFSIIRHLYFLRNAICTRFIKLTSCWCTPPPLRPFTGPENTTFTGRGASFVCKDIFHLHHPLPALITPSTQFDSGCLGIIYFILISSWISLNSHSFQKYFHYV